MAARELNNKAQSSTRCSNQLSHSVRPIIQLSSQAKILIAGQAPGAKAHTSGKPFDDPSGECLRNWIGIDASTFYDNRQIAILPMSFCYPNTGNSGDLAPKAICAATWRNQALALLTNLKLTIVVGQYA